DPVTREELADKARRVPDELLAAIGRVDVIAPLLAIESGAAPASLLPQVLEALSAVPAGGVPLHPRVPGLHLSVTDTNPLAMAEAIVHGTQHGKLNALTWLDPVLENGHTEWSPSPVRPDLRPLMGVLLAAHAFVPVAALHARLAEQGHPAMLGKESRRAE